jgi:ABC-type branched-chain amino acid transport systems, periplasmic component
MLLNSRMGDTGMSTLTASRRAIVAAGIATFVALWGVETQAQDTIRFGTALSLTGNLATEGKQVREGYDFFVKTVNERGGIDVAGKKYKVEIVYYDDESNVNTSVKLYEKLISEDGVKFLLGPYGSGITIAVSNVVEQHKLPMVVAHGAASTIYNRGYKYTFGAEFDRALYLQHGEDGFRAEAAAQAPCLAEREPAVRAARHRRRGGAGQAIRPRRRLQGEIFVGHQGSVARAREDEGGNPT